MEDEFAPLDDETKKELEKTFGEGNVQMHKITDERRTFYIDVPPEKAEAFMGKMKEQLAKKKKNNDETI